jgi:hypothetical protein
MTITMIVLNNTEVFSFTRAVNLNKTNTNTPSTASPRSASVATNSPINPSGSPNYGDKHDQAVAVEMLKNLKKIKSLEDPNLGGITYESLVKTSKILMDIKSTANLSPEQKSILEAATDAWLSQNPSAATKINEPKQKNNIAKEIGTILKTLIVDNYQFVTAATIQDSNVLGKVALPDYQAYQLFFAQKLSLSEINAKKDEIGTATSPITGIRLG